MSQYLEEAAQLLRKAAEQNERNHVAPISGTIDHEARNAGRERIAMKFAQLGAIEKGLVPREVAAEFLASVRAPESGWSR